MTQHRHLYNRERGDQFVAIRNIGPGDVGRTFEIRDSDSGEGIAGKLADVVHDHLAGKVVVRMWGQERGAFMLPDDEILRKAKSFRAEDIPGELRIQEPAPEPTPEPSPAPTED